LRGKGERVKVKKEEYFSLLKLPFLNKIVINSTIALHRNYYINPLGVFNEVLLIDACVFR